MKSLCNVVMMARNKIYQVILQVNCIIFYLVGSVRHNKMEYTKMQSMKKRRIVIAVNDMTNPTSLNYS